MTFDKWTQESALVKLDRLRAEARELGAIEPGDEQLVSWTLRTRRFLSEVYGEASDYFIGFASIQWNAYPTSVIGGPARPEENFRPELGVRRIKIAAVATNVSASLGILAAARDDLLSNGLEQVRKDKNTGPEASAIVRLVSLAQSKLRRTIREAPTREREVQDRFEDLLIGASIGYTRETESVSYSSKTYFPDFTVEFADLAIEIKLCARDRREQEIIAEVNDDILAYRERWGNLLFVIYDVGQIRDVDRFTSAFESESVMIEVVKH